MMKIKFKLIVFIVCILAVITKSVYAESQTFIIDSLHSEITYSFKSTLHPVYGVAKEFKGEFVFNNIKTLALEKANVTVTVKGLNSENKKRDGNMYRMFEQESFPEIIFRASELIDLIALEDGKFKGTLIGQLIIKDLAKDFNIPVEINRSKGEIQLNGNVEVSFREYNLNPPSVLNLIKVSDPVTVEFNVLLK